MPGCEIHDDPLAPLCARVPRARRDAKATPCRSRWLPREARYVEKLATPDVTIADMVGDIDPIKAAQAGLNLSDELTMHYGLLPRANRGIFAINELPDLAGKIQVGLFNILQEGDVQIKGYPIRLKLDVHAGLHGQPGRLHGARQDHHAAQGPHRLGDPHALSGDAPQRDGDHEAGGVDRPRRRRSKVEIPGLRARGRRRGRVPGARGSQDRQALGRQPAAADHDARARRLERRAARARERRERSSCRASPTSTRRCPSITGKFELEYEGELRGAEQVARDLIRSAVGTVFTGMFDGVDTRTVVEWFDLGGSLPLSDTHVGRRGDRADARRAGAARARRARRRCAPARRRRSSPRRSTSCSKGSTRRRRSAAATSAATRPPKPPRRAAARREEPTIDEEIRMPAGKKKYYN